jgi:hypothetical protein
MVQKKNPIKTDGWNHHTKDKREGQRKANRCAAPHEHGTT